MWLGIETSSLVSSVALMDESCLIGELTIQAGLTHSEQLVPHIERYYGQHWAWFFYGFTDRYGDS